MRQGQSYSQLTCYVSKKKRDKCEALVKTKRPYATMRHKKNSWYCASSSKKSQIHLYTHSKNTIERIKRKKCNICIQVVLLWLFVQYNLTFSENIHLDINSSTNVQNLQTHTFFFNYNTLLIQLINTDQHSLSS